jgi:sporulation-control protein spo0M
VKPASYQVTVRGHLSQALVAALDGVTAVSAADATVLGDIADQAALHGVLERIEALGLELLDVRRVASAR